MKTLRLFLLVFLVLVLTSCNLPVAPFVTPTPTITSTPTVTPTPTASPTPTATSTPTLTPTATQTPSPTPIILPTTYTIKGGDTLSSISEYFDVPIVIIAIANKIENTNLIYSGKNLYIPDPKNLPTDFFPKDKKILVVLSEQKVYAFENNALLKEFLVSTGVADHPTVTGKFQVLNKLEKTDMSGEGYDLKDVPWTMYFYKDYALHGTYWHTNFGRPMSHGCVNLTIEDAKWLYDFAPVGTIVEVIP